jgi:hypothetical protein
MNKLVIVAALLLTASPALAGSAGEPPEAKIEQTAIGLSLLGTVAPAALLVTAASAEQPRLAVAGAIGLLVGPSFGHWYAGRYITGGLLVRGGGTVLMFAGVAQALGNIDCEERCGSDGAALAVAGAVLFVGGTLYDIATAGGAAHKWNEKHLNMGPTAVSSASGPVPGFAVAGSF